MVNLDRCVGSCNTLNDLYNKAYVQNEIFKRRFKSKRFQRDYRVNNIDKPHIMRL